MDKKDGIAGLIERFANLPDARVEGRTDHDLLDIVVLALAVKSTCRQVGIDDEAICRWVNKEHGRAIRMK